MELSKYMFGERLTTILLYKGLSLTEFSDKTGIALSTLSRFRSNDRTPRLENLQLIAEQLSATDFYWLITGNKQGKRKKLK